MIKVIELQPRAEYGAWCYKGREAVCFGWVTDHFNIAHFNLDYPGLTVTVSDEEFEGSLPFTFLEEEGYACPAELGDHYIEDTYRDNLRRLLEDHGFDPNDALHVRLEVRDSAR